MHVKNGKGEAMFVTPKISKTGKDGKSVVINDIPSGGPALALGIAYLTEVIAFTKPDTDNRLENKTARSNARIVIDAVSAGDASDKFTYSMPNGLADDGNLSGEWVPVMTCTRKDLIHAANLLIKADDLLSNAEAKVKELATGAGFNIGDVNMPVYASGSGGRAKRASGKITI